MADTGHCAACGIEEHMHLLDGKRSPGNEHDESADFDRLECVACYGPGWHPCAVEHIALSVARRLTPFYQKWRATHGIATHESVDELKTRWGLWGDAPPTDLNI